jgi:hypothetical protein
MMNLPYVPNTRFAGWWYCIEPGAKVVVLELILSQLPCWTWLRYGMTLRYPLRYPSIEGSYWLITMVIRDTIISILSKMLTAIRTSATYQPLNSQRC